MKHCKRHKSFCFTCKACNEVISNLSFCNQHLTEFVTKARMKFLKGAAEHRKDGPIWNYSKEELIKYLEEELIDAIFYLAALKEKIEKESSK